MPVAVVDDQIQPRRPAPPQVETGGCRILAVDHAGEGLGLRFSDRQHVLEARTAALISILDKEAIFLAGLQTYISYGVSQMAVERVDPVTVVVELVQSISLLVLEDDVRIGLRGEALGIDLHRERAILAWMNSNQSASRG